MWRVKFLGYFILGVVALGGFGLFCDWLFGSKEPADQGVVVPDAAEEEETIDESFEIVPPFAILNNAASSSKKVV